MSDAKGKVEAKRRGEKSWSRSTGKPVSNSNAVLNGTGKLGASGSILLSFAAPPQIDDARAYELARLQLLGFYYLLTYEPHLSVGHCWPGSFFPIQGTIASDWGNPVQRAFMKAVAQWDYRLVLHTADDYYKAAIRRHPTEELWSWAVEWNKSYRLVGLLGDLEAAKATAATLPQVPAHSNQESGRSFLRIRAEELLNDEDDVLFRLPAD